jgi:exonuclease III
MVSVIIFMGSIIVWNVCGLGGREKKRCLRNLGRKFNLDVLDILETKLENLNDYIITSIWGRHPRAWYAVPFLGLSRGILCIWNPDLFCVSSCFIAMNGRILHVEGIFTRFNLDCLVSFVYAPNVGNLKNELWKYLLTFRDSVSKPWCLTGDFNETLFHQIGKVVPK